MSVPETPKNVRRNFDQVIDRLNSRWDLQLPRLHGRVAEQAESGGAISRRITSRIRYLCFRPQLNLESLLDDFEDFAKQVNSNWVFKPHQEVGTLPQLPNAKSRLFEDSLAEPLRLTSVQRKDLLGHLDKLLDDEYRLSLDSQDYQRSLNGGPDKASKQDPHTRRLSLENPATSDISTPATPPGRDIVESKMAKTSPAAAVQNGRKRYQSRDPIEVNESPSKRRSSIKRQTSITDIFKSVTKPDSVHGIRLRAAKVDQKLKDDAASSSDLMPPPPVGGPTGEFEAKLRAISAPETSFTSNGSTQPPMVFTPPGPQGGTSSNETSFQSADIGVGSQDSYPCTQNTTDALDWSFHEATELMQVDDPPGSDFKVPYLPELKRSGPFREFSALFPSSLSFRKRYELLRISQSSGLSVADLLSCTLPCGDDYQKLWAAVSLLAANSASKLPDAGKVEVWNLAHGTYQDTTQTKSVIFSGTLEWNNPGVPGLFHLRLQPLKLEESCRFHRAYGSDRFMSISMPPLSPSYLPEHLKCHYEAVHSSVTEWLATCGHDIAGRKWKAFYVEGAKRRWRKRNRDVEDSKKREKTVNIQGFKIHLFAIDGIDILRMERPLLREDARGPHTKDSIENFLNWHIPIKANIKSADCKVFQRFALGLSQTLATVVLNASEFVHIENQQNSLDGPVMNDGCARISGTLGKAIAQKLGLEEVPSVFQARIAGAKGVWMVDNDELFAETYPTQMRERNFGIEISDSQLKIKPHPVERLEAHVTQRTFEVVAWSTMPRPASLNFQILAILHDRGVSKEVLKRLLLADQCQYHEALFQAMNNRIRLREWIDQNKTSTRGQEDIPFVGAWPDEIDEQIIMLLESGFVPQDCPLLLERIRTCLERNLDRYVDKLQIRVPQSTYLYCIADPYGVLQPDEVHVGFSGTWKDPVTGLSSVILDGIDVLVGRLPALLPSDIQRQKAVWRKELQHFRDVVVFPSTGDVPLAEMLSGGDYDGDMPWLCWDKSIVEAFVNVEVPKDPPSKAECRLETRSREMSVIFNGVSENPSCNETENFFRGCFRFNLYPSLLGTCTLEHEKVSYHEGSLSHDGAKKLAALSSYLVDSSKQGYFLSNQNWQKLRHEISPLKRQTPAYKEKETDPRPKESSIIDFLKFRIACSEKNRILTDFHRRWPRKNSYDSDPMLTSLWRTTQQKASSKLADVLRRLREDVVAIGEEWLKGMPKGRKFEEDGFNRIVTSLYQKFSMVQPLDGDHELSTRWIGETGKAYCHWHLLRASCMYDRFPGRTMCWFLAGRDLCQIKVNATGPSRVVLLEIYKTYRPDRKAVRRIAELDEDEVDEIDDD